MLLRGFVLFSLLAVMINTVHAEDCVVLLHGLASFPMVMKPIELALGVQPEYRTVNQGYASYSDDVNTLAAKTLPEAIEACDMRENETIHFVTHSMGGIILRAFLAENDIAQLGSVVMIAPPNNGSEVVDWVEQYAVLKPFLGPAGRELGTSDEGFLAQLPPPHFHFGVIAGVRERESSWSGQLPGDDDGKVSTESAQIEQMADYIEVSATHTGVLYKKVTIEQVISFLRYGHFLRHSEQRYSGMVVGKEL